MSATTTSVEDRKLTLRLSVENAEDRVHSGCVYAPSGATVRYSAFTAPSGEIFGPIRKEDGTFSVEWVTEYWRYETPPEWLKAVVAAERPEWAAR